MTHTWMSDWVPPSVVIRRKLAEERRLADVDYQNMLLNMQLVNDECSCVLPEHSCLACVAQARQRHGDRIPYGGEV